MSYSVKEVVTLLSRRVISKGGMRHVALEFGVSVAYISDVLNRKRDPGPKILQGLGLEKVVTYRIVKGEGK